MIFYNQIRKKLSLTQIQFFLLCLIPLGLIFSRFVADFSVVLICIVFFYFFLTNKKNYFNNFFFKFFFVFWLFIVLRSIVSEDILFSLKSSFSYLRFAIFALAIKYIFEKNTNRIYTFFIFLLFVLLFTGLDGLIQFFTGQNILGYDYQLQYLRLSGFFKDEWIIGSYLSRLTPTLVGLYFLSKHLHLSTKINDNHILLLVVFLFLPVILSGERVSTIFFFITFILSFIFLNTSKIKKFLSIFLIIIPLFIAINTSDVIQKRLFKQTFQQIGVIKSEESQLEKVYFFSIHHHYHAIAAYKIFKENIFFGSGVKMFRVICEKRYKSIHEFACTTHPHNIILQFLAETGLIGFFFYFFSLIYVIKKMIISVKFKKIAENSNHKKAIFFFLLAILIGLFPILPSGNFFNNWLSIILFLPVGLYIAHMKDSFKKR
jgi:O-antigen ligase